MFGLSENRCPECGQAFDPNDSTTYLLEEKPKPGWVYLGAASAFWVMAMIARAVLYSGFINGNIPAVILVILLMVAAFGAGIAVIVPSISALRRLPPMENTVLYDLAVIASGLNILSGLLFVVENIV